MIKISGDGLFIINMPEDYDIRNKEQILFVSIASISGLMCTSDDLISNLISCFKAFSHRENVPEIVFFVNYEGINFVISANIKMVFSDYEREVKKFIK